MDELLFHSAYEDFYTMAQTECALEPYERFREKMARYIFVARK